MGHGTSMTLSVLLPFSVRACQLKLLFGQNVPKNLVVFKIDSVNVGTWEVKEF